MVVGEKRVVAGIEMTFIPASEVPPASGRTDWDSIFSGLPKGMAFVFTKGVTVKYLETPRDALKRRHKQGKFLELTTQQRWDKLYVYRKREGEEE